MGSGPSIVAKRSEHYHKEKLAAIAAFEKCIEKLTYTDVWVRIEKSCTTPKNSYDPIGARAQVYRQQQLKRELVVAAVLDAVVPLKPHPARYKCDNTIDALAGEQQRNELKVARQKELLVEKMSAATSVLTHAQRTSLMVEVDRIIGSSSSSVAVTEEDSVIQHTHCLEPTRMSLTQSTTDEDSTDDEDY
jgi:6-phosphofructokinase